MFCWSGPQPIFMIGHLIYRYLNDWKVLCQNKRFLPKAPPKTSKPAKRNCFRKIFFSKVPTRNRAPEAARYFAISFAYLLAYNVAQYYIPLNAIVAHFSWKGAEIALPNENYVFHLFLKIKSIKFRFCCFLPDEISIHLNGVNFCQNILWLCSLRHNSCSQLFPKIISVNSCRVIVFLRNVIEFLVAS